MNKLLMLAALALPLAASAETPPPTDVVVVSHNQVSALFARMGGPLVVNDLYKVQAGKRVGPGAVEVHTKDTDVFYIVDGAADFKTGGKGVSMKESAPNEFRGKSIDGGTTHHLQKGDVIVIPAGTPHQFMAVDSAFLYFVVKVTQS